MPGEGDLPESQALWHLLQISDQLFPTGGYAFSHALETYVAQGLVHDRISCFQWLTAFCEYALGPGDLVFCITAWRLAANALAISALDALLELDQLLAASKTTREFSQESQHTGQALLRGVMALAPNALVTAFWHKVRQGETPGHHALAFGLSAQAIGVPEPGAATAYCYTVMAALVAVAIRLVPLGQTDGQRLLHELAPYSLATYQRYHTLTPYETWNGLPLLELRSMQHERLYSRLFRS